MSRRRVDVRPGKEINNVHPIGVHIWGTLWVPHYRVPFRAPVNAHPWGVHMGHRRCPIIGHPFGVPVSYTYGAPFRVPHMHHPLGGALMHALKGHAYGHPQGAHWSRERAEGEWTCDHEKKNKSRPIMGAPRGHPYAHPRGVCINGLGALPSPYGPTLCGAHNGPSGLQKKKNIGY